MPRAYGWKGWTFETPAERAMREELRKARTPAEVQLAIARAKERSKVTLPTLKHLPPRP